MHKETIRLCDHIDQYIAEHLPDDVVIPKNIKLKIIKELQTLAICIESGDNEMWVHCAADLSHYLRLAAIRWNPSERKLN